MQPALLLLAGASHAGELQRLGTHTAEASSWFTSDRGRFVTDHHPTYAIDDDRATAWVEGVEGDEVGESITSSRRGASSCGSATATRAPRRRWKRTLHPGR